jgi:hypothetical protein
MGQADLLSNEDEFFITVGLNSGMEGEFDRKMLNLVVVLDISGSMASPFDSYHYDPAPRASNSNDSKVFSCASSCFVS